MIDVAETIEKFSDDEFIKFDRVTDKIHPRRDLCAFLLLDRLAPNPNRKMVSGAEHDKIYLDVSPEAIEHATEDDIRTLVRCGVMYDEETDSLTMFV